MERNSPEKAADQVLGMLSVERIRGFLEDCVNLPNPIDYPEDAGHFERWLKRWQRLFTYRVEVEDEDGEGATLKMQTVAREELVLFAPIVRTTLCRLWREQDARQRDWYCYRLRDAHRLMVRHLEGWGESTVWGGKKTVQRLLDYALQDAPAISPFEAAIYWAQTNQKLMLYCGNPTCATPYFFRAEKGQKFCSPNCADPARKESKLKWWNEHRKKK